MRIDVVLVRIRRLVALLPALLVPVPAVAADLGNLYQQAKEADPTIRAARASRDATREGEPIAKSQLLPNVTVTGDVTLQDQDVKGASGFTGGDDTFNSQSAAVAVTQPLYRPARSLGLEQARIRVRQADSDYAIAEQDLIQRVVDRYFAVLAAKDTLAFAQSELKAIARQLDQAKQRFDVGLIAITGVHEAQARFDQARADEIVAGNQLDNAREALREIAGDWSGGLAGLPEDIDLQHPDPQDPARWAEIALESSPEIASSREAVDVARKEIDVQRAGDSATLDAVGSYTLSRTDRQSGADTNNAAIGLQLAVPLYTGGGVAAATRQAAFNLEAAQENLEATRRNVLRRVRDAYRAVEASISRVRALKASSLSATSALDATQAGFEVGTRTLVDVLNGQRDLFRAARDYAQSRYDYIFAKVALLQAAGILTEDHLERISARLVAQ